MEDDYLTYLVSRIDEKIKRNFEIARSCVGLFRHNKIRAISFFGKISFDSSTIKRRLSFF